MRAPLRVGFAAFDLDPPMGLRLDGYDARRGRASGSLDRLRGRVCYLQRGRRVVVVALLDVLGVSGAYVAEVRRRLRRAVASSAPHTVVAATHTHSGPVGFAAYPEGDRAEVEFAERTARQLVSAVAEARQDAREAFLWSVPVDIAGVAGDRVDPTVEVADLGYVTVVTAADSGERLGLHANVACHPTVLGADNLDYSADLFGAAAARLERLAGCPCLLSIGAAAEVSTRFWRREQTAAEVERLGGRVAEAIHGALRSGVEAGLPERAAGGNDVRFASTSLVVPTRVLPTLKGALDGVDEARSAYRRAREEQRDAGTLRGLWTRLEGAQALVERIERGGLPATVAFELTAMTLGDTALAFVPGEVFASSFRSWRREWNLGNWRMVTLANGYLGYFPSERAVSEGYYEALCSPFDARATERLGRAVKGLLERLEGA